MMLNINATNQIARCEFILVMEKSRNMAPRKNISSDKAARMPTMQTDTIKEPIVAPFNIELMKSDAVFSASLNAVSNSLRLSGKVMLSFHWITSLSHGVDTSNVRRANMVFHNSGAMSTKRKRAGSLVIIKAVMMAGRMNMNRSCSTVEMRMAIPIFAIFAISKVVMNEMIMKNNRKAQKKNARPVIGDKVVLRGPVIFLFMTINVETSKNRVLVKDTLENNHHWNCVEKDFP